MTPQFALFNAVLRRWPEPEFERGNKFTTTIHVLVSAVTKLTRVTKFAEGDRLFRGTGGRMALPRKFHQADDHGRKGFTEWGFMSTTSNRAVAIQYSGVREARALATVLVIKATSIDFGASVSFFSQYQGEAEVLFSPLCFLAPEGQDQIEVTANGVLSVVEVRVNVNLKAGTTDDLVEQKKRSHLASFHFLISDLGPALRHLAEEGKADERLSRDSVRVHQGVTHTVDGLLQRVLSQVKEVLAEHETTPAEAYTDDTKYKALVTDMLDSGAKAASVFRLYLEDPSRQIYWMMRTTLVNAHRALAAFRARAMQPLEGEVRRAAALRLCQQKGLVMERVDEASRAGESPLVHAVADGTVGPAALALLIEAGAGVVDGKALHAAAEHGQWEAVAALLGAKAAVDCVAVEVRRARRASARPLAPCTREGSCPGHAFQNPSRVRWGGAGGGRKGNRAGLMSSAVLVGGWVGTRSIQRLRRFDAARAGGGPCARPAPA
jgi:hypothetical protein